MSFDLVMRTLGVLTCLYTVAYFVTTMSVAALNGVTYNSGPMCGDERMRHRRQQAACSGRATPTRPTTPRCGRRRRS